MDDAAASGEFELIENLPFTTDRGVGARARIGVVVLASDYTIEHEFRQVLDQPDVALFVARIKNSPQITPETLAAMGPLLTETAERILPGDSVDVLAYGCTSASTVLGTDKVDAFLRAAKPMARPTNPIASAFAAFEAFGARRIAVLTPYRRDVNAVVRETFEAAGYRIPVFGSFNEENDPVVAAIDAESLKAAVRAITTGRDVDAVFVSCTSIRLLDAVAEIEAETGLPVTSSNHAMAWRCLRLAGIENKRPEFGRLYSL